MINAAGRRSCPGRRRPARSGRGPRLGDVLKMAKAFALAAETSPEGSVLAERLLVLAMDGLRPQDEGTTRPDAEAHKVWPRLAAGARLSVVADRYRWPVPPRHRPSFPGAPCGSP